jgi:bacterial/archaeal transporter family protein
MKTQYFVLMSILGWGIGSFLYKFATNSMHPITIAIFSLLTYATIIPFAFIAMKVDMSINFQGIIFTILSSLFLCCGTLGFSFALKSGGAAGEITSLTALYPALTLTLSCIFIGESLSVRKIIGIGLALLSVIILGAK